MDIIHFLLKLLTIGFVLSMCQAVNCIWKTQYEHMGRCCDACPSGEYPKIPCNDTKPSTCEKCPAASSSNTRCSCGSNLLCNNTDCSQCISRPRCKRGEELRRNGNYIFSYICEPCLNTTYNDAEDSMCEPIADCRKFGLSVLFPGNMTHNARCGWQSDDDHLAHIVMGMCLAITSLICVVLLIDVCIQRAMHKKRKTICMDVMLKCIVRVLSDTSG
ncbi:tumor necrosis factor receptor superfamily member 18 isoform X2 [Electrophorus electricus]|uniref:Tumor necrosis factor receptor superfamily, member 18 n=1 Tax=Electrophorus electricus TaxID=8005 RepID=A0A4W4DZQ5_ELEEL|nr:tumor necrosis factor receptor superfamily member 18 isoform X2 [Electrophorus electricus]